MERLIYEHKDLLYRLCLHLERNKYYAEELFQDTWVKAIEKIYLYDDSYAFYPWLSQIAVNIYRDRLRRIKIELKYTFFGANVENEQADKKVDLEKSYITQEELEITKRCLDRLEDKYRLPILLSLNDNLSYKEIAQILEQKETTIKSRIYEGRQKLKNMLKKEELYG